MQNAIQYASFLVAIGCELNFNTRTAELDVLTYPKDIKKRRAVAAALRDIEKFSDTANFSDGITAYHLCAVVDGDTNPLDVKKRLTFLNTVGIMQGTKFVAHVMMSAKSNRSWHGSEEPNTCTYFGDICTRRGTVINPNRRGIRSTRSPKDYHTRSSPTTIKREQLITPALDAAYALIPDGVMATGNAPQTILDEHIEQQLETLEPEKIEKLLSDLKAAKERLSANS